MKKDRFVFLLSIIFIANCFMQLYSIKQLAKPQANVFLLDNIEALAAGETHKHYFCYGYGSVSCPSGDKVEYMIDNL